MQRPLVYIKLTGGDVTKANSGVLDRIVIEVRILAQKALTLPLILRRMTAL